MSCCIILGSSEEKGKTYQAVQDIFQPLPSLFFLGNYRIGPFQYGGGYQQDDFLTLADQLLSYDTWIFATPIYWYTMSGQMKVFIDRFTDLITPPHKDKGRQLRGKKVYLISTSMGPKPEAFEDPFQQTFAYLGMTYRGSCHIRDGGNEAYAEENLVNKDKGRAFFQTQCC